jgi:hypothetical protein
MIVNNKNYFNDSIIYDITPQLFILANTDNLRDTSINIINKLNKFENNYSIHNIYENNYFIYDFSIIKYNNDPILVIFKSESCMTYNVYDNYRIATINTIIRMYLGIILSKHKIFIKYTKILECCINNLSRIQLKYKYSKIPLLDTFVNECYGNSENLITLRKKRVLRLKNQERLKNEKDYLE